MKFKIGDKVKIMSVEEIKRTYPKRIDEKYECYRSSNTVLLRGEQAEICGKICTVRLVRPSTCRIKESTCMTTSIPNELMELIERQEDPVDILEPDERTKNMALGFAMVVRNAMEGFHAKHLSDKQMAELNPIIRNALYTALHATVKYDESRGSRVFVNFHNNLIPDYWEKPELLKEFVLIVKNKTGYECYR